MSLPPLTWACCRGWSCPCCRCWWRTWPRSCRSSRRSSRTCSPTGSHWAGTRCGPSITDLFSQCNYMYQMSLVMILTCLHSISCLWSYSLQSDDNFKLFPAKNKDYPLCSLLNNKLCCRSQMWLHCHLDIGQNVTFNISCFLKAPSLLSVKSFCLN